jgi:dihydrofolate synthase/folylpolyglutamate synthase
MSSQSPLQATSPLAMWLAYLESIHSTAIDLGLERVSTVAESAQLIHLDAKVITVAGTNGKGSTCAIMEAILLDAGYSVGVYSSPHLVKFNERIRINGQDVDDQTIVESFDEIEKVRGNTSLSFFEFTTLAALNVFKKTKVDIVLLEVGLGGRLDATNVVEHDVSVITSLAVDHVDWLGSDINVIGFEKAGIFRGGKPAICGQPDAPYTVASHADDIGAKLYQIDYQYSYQVIDSLWNWRCGQFDLTDLPIPNLPLQNAATALTALGVAELDLTDVNIVNGLKNAKLPGRMQLLSQQPLILLDVAHNPHSADYLVSQLHKNYPHKNIHIVLGMLHDKDIDATISALAPVVSHWYLASLEGPRAATAQELAQCLPSDVKCLEFDSVKQAFEQALAAATDKDLILVAGSFHTVGLVLEEYESRRINGK